MNHIERIYISGQITGLQAHEYLERFTDSENLIREMYPEAEVINPVRCISEVMRYAPTLTKDQIMEIDLAMLSTCDAIWLIPGWEESDGAKQELSEAIASGMEVICQVL